VSGIYSLRFSLEGRVVQSHQVWYHHEAILVLKHVFR